MTSEISSADPILEPAPERKKARRIWLFLPFVLLLIAAAGYGAWWFVVSHRVTATLDQRAEALRQAGYMVDLTDRKVAGFPFRLKLTYGEARIVSPSGWSLTIPGLEAEAFVHSPGHWVAVAPQGLTFVRPQGGAVAVKGESLRASIAGTDADPWRIVLQGRKAVLTPAAGARPFSLASADLVEFYIRPAPQPGEGMFLLRLEGGKAQAGSLLGRIGGEGAITAAIDGRLTKVATFRGASWGDAVRAWSGAQGVANAIGGTLTAGTFTAKATGGTLGVGAGGRLVGAIPLELKQAQKALTALADVEAVDAGAAGSAAAVAAARAQGEASTVNLVFQAGVITFGPVMVGPSPKVG